MGCQNQNSKRPSASAKAERRRSGGCERNGLELNAFDKRFIEVDHIKAWELCNLNEENLQCLCVLCHSQKDTVHQKNYSKGANLKKVKEFVKKYKNDLEKCANPYLKDWLLKYPEH